MDLPSRLLEKTQRGFPVCAAPFEAVARDLGAEGMEGVTEADVLQAYQAMTADGRIDRVGAVVAPGHAGVSTLAAMAVPAERLEAVAEWVSACPEVNHNYEREGELNLWFVVHARSEAHLNSVMKALEIRTGLQVHDLRLVEEYRIDLGFPL